MLRCLLPIVVGAVLIALPLKAAEFEAQALRETVTQFLARVSAGDASVHREFWAEDLVYTSAAGRRFGKVELLAGLASADPAAPATRFSARELSVRFEQGVALVEFRLIAESDGEPEQSFFNTGVFRRSEDGRWQAFAWQATRASVD